MRTMDVDLALVTDWLICASSQIDREYICLPVAGGDPQFRERVYCYELYHRWRCHWSEKFPYSLGGEVDKKGHPRVRGKQLDNTKPDFLVHVPGYMRNLLVMEVKPANGKIKHMIADLKKLTAYTHNLVDEDERPANYYAAFFWVYGTVIGGWQELQGQVLAEIGNREEVDLSGIRCFVHEGAGVPAVEVRWR